MPDSTPVLSGLNLVVRDMDATVEFYRHLGLEIPDSVVWRTNSGAHHADLTLSNGFGLDFDSEPLAKSYNAGYRGVQRGGGSVIGFSVDSRDAVDARYANLIDAGYTGLQPPHDAFWGARYAIIEDPDGNHVGLMSPIDLALRSGAPSV